jgi:O-methyltransferase
MDKFEEDSLIGEVHKRIQILPYLQAIYDGQKIGPLDFLPLAADCLSVTQTTVASFKSIRRYERLSVLLRFFLQALKNCEGAVVECGVYRGFSVLAMGRLMKSIVDQGGPPVRDIWAIDSYAGLSEPVQEDWMKRTIEGKVIAGPSLPKGRFATPLEIVQENLRELTNVKFAKGWIPEAFDLLPDQRWSFAHIDVDLYEPVRDSLAYFYPRLEKGGILINDDFGSVLFPGAGKAWREFFDSKGKGYAILDTGQAVYINE